MCKPEDYTEEIKRSYITHLNELVAKSNFIISYIENFFANQIIHCRYLIQTTASYARYISLLQHTAATSYDVIGTYLNERSTTLLGNEVLVKDFILSNEIYDIVGGVIPYFYRSNHSKSLYHASGSYSERFFSTTLIEDIKNHILSIKKNLSDIMGDVKFIEEALESTVGIENFEDFRKKFNFPMFDANNI